MRIIQIAQSNLREHYYTADQLQKVFDSFGVTEPLPGIGKQVIINFPPGRNKPFALAIVRREGRKSTYGKPLWRVTFTNDPNNRVRKFSPEEMDRWPKREREPWMTEDPVDFADCKGMRHCERCARGVGVKSNREWLTTDQLCDKCKGIMAGLSSSSV